MNLSWLSLIALCFAFASAQDDFEPPREIAYQDQLVIRRTSQDVAKEIIEQTEKDLVHSFDWAADQIVALVPTELEGIDDDDDGTVSKPPPPTPASPRPLIRKSLDELSNIIVRELKPGLTDAVVRLLKRHAADPDLADKMISKQELAVFMSEVSEIWTAKIQAGITKWTHKQLEALIGALGKVLAGVGKEVLRKLGQLGGFLLHQTFMRGCVVLLYLMLQRHSHTIFVNRTCRVTKRGNLSQNDLMGFIRVESEDIVRSSLNILHGPGWMAKTFNTVLYKRRSQIKSHKIF